MVSGEPHTISYPGMKSRPHELWEDAAFIAELDRRTAEYESGKSKVLTLDELETMNYRIEIHENRSIKKGILV
jgi:hypothetical protein